MPVVYTDRTILEDSYYVVSKTFPGFPALVLSYIQTVLKKGQDLSSQSCLLGILYFDHVCSLCQNFFSGTILKYKKDRDI